MKAAGVVMKRIVEPALVGFWQWRGDPMARLLQTRTKADPYPLYADVRRRGVVRSPLGGFVTASHASVAAVLRNPRFSSSPRHASGYRPPAYPAGDPRAELPEEDMLNLDPPDHTRIRRLVSRSFTPRAVAELEPWVGTTAERLLGNVDGMKGFDLIDDFAFQLPIAVICRLLGVPSEDRDRFRQWGHDVAAGLDPRGDYEEQTRDSELALTVYLRDLVARRRADPDDSLLSKLIADEEEGDRLSSGELVATALLLLVAGFETTVNLIGNGTVALLAEPEQWQRVVADPSLVPGAIEEMLRYDSPVQLTSRIATEDIEVGGVVVPRGKTVVVAMGGANRDPDVFEDADRLCIDRGNASSHLSFSFGIHHCLGAALARLEGRVAIGALTRRFPSLVAAGPPVRRPLLVLRGYEHVPVRIRPGGARPSVGRPPGA